MQLVLLAGPGGTGKSSTMAALAALCAERNIRVNTVRSTTRDTYACFGYASEKEALHAVSVDAQLRLQSALVEDFSEALINAVESSFKENRQMLFADRSLYDYVAYWYTLFANRLTIDEINTRFAYATRMMRYILKSNLVPVHTFFMPFPAPFSQDTESSDGWRADTTGKNFTWSNHLHATLHRSQVELFDKQYKVHFPTEFDRSGTSRDVAAAILRITEQHTHYPAG